MLPIFKALSHPARRQIIAMLQSGPLTSGQIAEAFDMAWPSITGHLAALKDAELVDAERHGNTVRYRLNISAAEEAAGFLLGVMQAATPARKEAMPAEREATPARRDAKAAPRDRSIQPRATARKKPA